MPAFKPRPKTGAEDASASPSSDAGVVSSIAGLLGRLSSGSFGRNFTALSSVSLMNLVFPLVTTPYLVRTLGLEVYGKAALAQYVAQIAQVALDFGFPLYGVSAAAKLNRSPDKLAELFGAVQLIKLAMLLLLAAILLSLWGWSPVLALDRPLLLLYVLNAAAVSFVPSWFFLGIERSGDLVAPSAISRAATLVGILAFVHGPQDLLLLPAAYAIPNLALMSYAIWKAVRTHQGRIVRPSRRYVGTVFRESLEVFWSRLVISGYVTASPIVVGQLVGTAGVGIYSVAERTLGIARVPFDVAANAFYPRAARRFDGREVKRFIGGLAVLALLGWGVIAGSADWIARFVVGAGADAQIGTFIALYCAGLPAIAAHGVLGTSVLLVHGRRFDLLSSLLVALGVYLVVLSIFSIGRGIDLFAVVASMVAVEYALLISRIIFSKRAKLL